MSPWDALYTNGGWRHYIFHPYLKKKKKTSPDILIYAIVNQCGFIHNVIMMRLGILVIILETTGFVCV